MIKATIFFSLGFYITTLAGNTLLYFPKCLMFKIILGIKFKKTQVRLVKTNTCVPYIGSLFYVTSIVCHFLATIRAFGWPLKRLRSVR